MNKYRDFSIRQVLSNQSHTTNTLSPEAKDTINRFPNLKLTQRINCISTPILSSSPILASTSFEIPSLNLPTVRTPDSKRYFESRMFESPLKPDPNLISIKLPNIDPKVPKKNDFASLLDQIETVVSAKQRYRSLVLREDEAISKIISPKDPIFYKIFTKGKKTPLSVKIKEYESKTVTYISYSDPHPRQASHDRVFNKNYFEISDRAFEFKSDILYFGVYSEKESRHKIQIYFGKIRSLNQLRSEKITHKSLEPDPDFSELKPAENKSFIKDFIKANKDVQYQLNISKLRDLHNEQEIWSKKREEILLKKKNLVLQKKQKTIESLNRRAKRLESEELGKIEQDFKNSLNKSKSFLLVIVYLLKSTERISQLVRERREFILMKIKKNMKARMIQRNIKKIIVLDKHISAKSIARHCLLLFKGVFKGYYKKTSEKKIVKGIINTAKSNIMLKQLGGLTEKILKIQRSFRKHLGVKKNRMKKLYDFWKYCVDKMAYDKQDKITKNKVNKYKAIPHSSKKRFLSNYYLNCWVAFRAKIRDFYLKKREGSRPRLVYMPSEAKMMEMINNLL